MYLLRGAPGSGKTSQVFHDFREALKHGRTNVRIVLPTATLVRHYQHELARDGDVFPPRWIMSFSRFTHECAGPGVKVIPDGLRRAIVRQVLQSGIAPAFNAVSNTEGMTATILDTIDLFENAGATPATLKSKRSLQPLGSAFLKVWTAVEEQIEAKGFATRRQLFQTPSKDLVLYLDGFLTFSRLEIHFLKLLDRANHVTLVLPDGREADEAHRMALEAGAKYRLLRAAHARPKPRADAFHPPTIEREADEICRRILELNTTGTPFRDIGVALRDNATYLPLLRTAFERFGIPARFYFADTFHDHPVAKFLQGLVEGALSNWEFERTLETFRAHPRWCASTHFDAFDFSLREAMPGRGIQAITEVITSFFKEEDNWLRKRLLHALQIDKWTTEQHTPLEWAALLTSMTEMVEDRPADPATDYTSLAAARSYSAAINIWIQSIQQAAQFWPPALATSIPLDTFYNVARETLAGATLRIADDRRNVVHIMSAFEARQWEVGVLFLPGVSDRDYPRRHPENLLFPDPEIRKLGIPLRTAQELDDEEHHLFPSLRYRARNILFLSAPTTDQGGRKIVRSNFLLTEGAPETKTQRVKPAPRVSPAPPAATGIIGDPALLEQLAALHRTVSPTGLETLAQCSFQFFAEKALRLKRTPDRPEDRYNALVRGSILHAILHRWTEGADIRRLFDDIFEEERIKARIPESYALEVKRFEMSVEVQQLDLSQRWYSDERRTELELQMPLREGITLRGKADRIDILGADCIVVDYKSGNAANVGNLIGDTTRLQGPLYALAAREQLGLNPIAMIYWALRNGKLYGWGHIPNTQLDLAPMPPGWMEAARERIVGKLDRYLAGEVNAHPSNIDQCIWCNHKDACRVEQAQFITISGAQNADHA